MLQSAANWPSRDSQVMERLLMAAWLSRIPAWKAKTTCFDARYPPPLLPPVLRRTITWISCAREKSMLAVPAHCATMLNHPVIQEAKGAQRLPERRALQ